MKGNVTVSNIRAGRRGYSLVEVLVIGGVLSLLAGILLPTINVASESSRRTTCANQLREIGQAMMMYVQDNRGYMPAGACVSEAYPNRIWDITFKCNAGLLIDPYLQNRLEVLYCPTTVKNDLPRAQQFFGVKGFDVAVPYQQRLASAGGYTKYGKGKRQAVMFDMYIYSDKPALQSFINVSHKQGVNCLFSDNSVIWEKLPLNWNSGNATKSWPQLDAEQFSPMF